MREYKGKEVGKQSCLEKQTNHGSMEKRVSNYYNTKASCESSGGTHFSFFFFFLSSGLSSQPSTLPGVWKMTVRLHCENSIILQVFLKKMVADAHHAGLFLCRHRVVQNR